MSSLYMMEDRTSASSDNSRNGGFFVMITKESYKKSPRYDIFY